MIVRNILVRPLALPLYVREAFVVFTVSCFVFVTVGRDRTAGGGGGGWVTFCMSKRLEHGPRIPGGAKHC